MKEIVLLDFGISKISRNDQDTGVIAMSYYYCSPEVKNDDISKVSQKSDIFSVGMSIDYLFIYLLLEFCTNYSLKKKHFKIIQVKEE